MIEHLNHSGRGPATGQVPCGPAPDDLPTEAVIARVIDAARVLAGIVSDGHVGRIAVSAGAVRWEIERHEEPSGLAGTRAREMEPATSAGGRSAVDAEQAGGGQVVTAPLVGVYYQAPGPGLPPFAALGSRVAAGQQVAIIEAMKTMNEVVAPCAGVVSHVHVQDTEIVEHGQPLITIQPGEPG